MNVDERCGKFAEACWAFKRGETAAKPVPEDLHPFLAEAVARSIGVTVERKTHQAAEQQTLKL